MKKIPYAKLSIAVIVIFAAIRLIFAATHTVSGDACWHLSAARFIAEENSMPLFEGIGRLEPFWAPPLFHIIAAFFYKIAMPISLDFADLASKLVSPIFGVLTVILLYLIARRMFDEKTAFYSMLFINFLPVFMDYSIFSYIETTTTFFSALSVYLLLKEKYFWSSLALGLAILAKYNALFMFPMLLYLIYKLAKGRKLLTKRLSIMVLVPAAISSIWFLRNYILLGNPFWPFLNNIFHGVNIGASFNKIAFGPLFSLDTYLKFYLELFGIPHGSLELLNMFVDPAFKFVFLAWASATVIFIFPFVIGLFRPRFDNKEKEYFVKSMYILFFSFLVMFFIYLVNVGWFGSRLLFAVLPFMAIVWAIGMNSVKRSNAYLLLILIIGFGFIAAEAVKLNIAAKEWGIYKADFQWARDNTKQSDLFFGNGQCLSYNIKRQVINHKAAIDFGKVGYVWTNDRWKIDFKINKDSLDKIKQSKEVEVVYDNAGSGTTVYKVKQ